MRRRNRTLATGALLATVAFGLAATVSACTVEEARPSTHELIVEASNKKMKEQQASPYQPEDWEQIGYHLYEQTVTTEDGDTVRCITNYSQSGLDCETVRQSGQ